jgi:methionyl-tRNA synthetase
MLHKMKVVEKMLEWENAGKTKLLSVGYSLRAPELLFQKIENDVVAAQVAKLKSGLIKPKSEDGGQKPEAGGQKPETGSEPKAVKEQIQYDDFAKLDLRVGTIVAAEKVPKADKLLKLQVDLGFETRTIVSGIAEHFKPEEITGKQVVVVANLAPRKMRGIESNGMILMAEDKAGKLHFVNPIDAIDNGSSVS